MLRKHALHDMKLWNDFNFTVISPPFFSRRCNHGDVICFIEYAGSYFIPYQANFYRMFLFFFLNYHMDLCRVSSHLRQGDEMKPEDHRTAFDHS